MSSSHKNLTDYFAAARAQEPVLPLEEVTQAISQFPAGAAGGDSTSAVAGRKTAFWAAGSVGALAVTALLWFALADQPKVSTHKPVAFSAKELPTQKASPGEEKVLPKEIDSPKSIKEAVVSQAGSAAAGGSAAVAPRSEKAPVAAPASTNDPVVKPAAPPVGPVAALEEGEKVFGSITLLELSRDIEQKLGIQVNEQGILYTRHMVLPTTEIGRMEFTIYNGRYAVNVFRKAKSADKGPSALATPQDLIPVYISNRQGENRVPFSDTKRKFEPEYFNEIVNTLMPVLVKAGNTAKDEAIFWFAATPDFLQLLPTPLAQEISEEYQQLAHQKQAAADSSQKEVAKPFEKITQYKYFESNPASKSSIQYAVVFPNPVADWLHLSMNLKREEEMRVNLVDINGRLVKVLSPYKFYPAGSVTEKFNLKGEAKGLYLLLAETKTGHAHTQRIIIE